MLQADLQLNHEVSVKPLDVQTKKVEIKFLLRNQGEVIATNTYIWIQFKNVKEIVECTGGWEDKSKINENVPTIRLIAIISRLIAG
jgi:hypothetical protein